MKFSETHEWVAINAGIGTIGISHHAQKELGQVVYVELPTIGKQVKCKQEIAVLESTKAAADVYAPISGEIIEVNQQLKEQPDLINTASETEGWICKVKLSDETELQQLIDEAIYQAKWKD